MWPFKSKPEPKDTTERLENLEKAMRRLEEDWSDVYGKFRTLQMRVAKQAQRIEQAPEREDTQPVVGDAATNNPAGNGATSLTPRQLQIQQQILARRNRSAA